MLIKYTYPVTTSLVLDEHWPLSVGDLKFEWHAENGIVTAISVIAPVSPHDRPPSFKSGNAEGKLPEIHMGDSPHADRVEHALRTIQGLLHLFAAVEVHFDREKVSWIPECDEDRSQLTLFSYSRKRAVSDQDEPRSLKHELVARIVASVNAASSFEIPLNFLRRGSREIRAERYIEAFYNLFFFLETLYAPGFSDPRKVKQKLISARPLIQALASARTQLSAASDKGTIDLRMQELLALRDDELLGHLVDVRGDLHHHALRRSGIWHPDKPEQFRQEALILLDIVHHISMAEMMPVLFAPDRESDVFRNAETAGAMLKLRVETIFNNAGIEHNASPVVFRIPGRRVSKEIVNHINSEMRRKNPHVPDIGTVVELRISSEDGAVVYGRYKRY